MSEAANQIFRQLNDADLKWGMIRNERGERVELGHSSFSAFLHSPSRKVRKEAFHPYYKQFDAHKNTIAATLNGSVQRDVYYAKRPRLQQRAGGGAVPRQRADVGLRQPDRLGPPQPAGLYRYYDLRRRAMKLKDDPPVRHLRADPDATSTSGTRGTRRCRW